METVIDCATHSFKKPVKTITDEPHVLKFEQSPAFEQYLGFVTAMQHSVLNSKMTETEIPESLSKLHAYIEELDALIDEIPPIEQPMRFGNKSF